MGKRTQVPGKEYTFIHKVTGEKDTGILPLTYGESNEFARWQPGSNYEKGGHWTSHVFNRKSTHEVRRGQGRQGLISRMRLIVGQQKNTAERRGYMPPRTTPEQMVIEWTTQNGRCAACFGPISLFGTRLDGNGACYDHNHETGEPRGFVHRHCNWAEGALVKMSDVERTNFLKWFETNLKKSGD